MGPTQPQYANNPVDAESDFPSEVFLHLFIYLYNIFFNFRTMNSINLVIVYWKWGGISSEEHDEAVMLEAAMFGGVPEGAGNRIPYSRNHYMRNGFERTGGPYTRSAAQSTIRPPSPSLTAQRLIREQQVNPRNPGYS